MSQQPLFTKVLHEMLRKAGLRQEALVGQVPESVRRVKSILSGSGKLPQDLAPWFKALKASPADQRRLEDAALLYSLPVHDQQRFVSFFHDDTHMASIRGTMVLADQVYCDIETRKWVVAGAYSACIFSEETFTIPNLQFYLRLQVDRPGTHAARISAVDVTASPTDPKLWSLDFELDIPESGIPVFQSRIMIPGPRLTVPVPSRDRTPGAEYRMRTSIWLRIDRTEVASCPLDFIFRPSPPKGLPNGNPSDDAENQSE